MQQDLWPDLPPPEKQPITQEESLAIVEPILPQLREVMDRALEASLDGDTATTAKGAPLDEGGFASVLHSSMKSFARDVMKDVPGVKVIDGVRFALSYGGVLLQIKKLGRNGLPSLSETRTSVRLARQLGDQTMLTIGVRVAKGRHKIARLELLCMRDIGKTWWGCVLREAAAANTAPISDEVARAGDTGRRKMSKKSEAASETEKRKGSRIPSEPGDRDEPGRSDIDDTGSASED